jgi:hypothetical protein
MPSDNERDYKVGYGKPPRHTRFQKGRSGNPHSRARETKNLSTLLDHELNERIVVTENGRRRTISKWSAFIKQLVNRAAGGDLRAGKMLLDLYSGTESRVKAAFPQTPDFTAADLRVLKELQVRLGRKKRESDD